MVSRDTVHEGGQRKAIEREVRQAPTSGLKTYIITAAQSNTHVNQQVWNNLLALAKHYEAEVMVGTFTYNKQSIGAKNAKRKTSRDEKAEPSKDGGEWWDDVIRPYIADRSIEIAPGLVWCGELQILPTAVRPLSGLESYTGRKSSIIPHTTHSVASVASPKHAGTKFLYTTGTVTLRNYIQKKAGQKASFHHAFGAVVVEVDSDGDWFVRHLNADSDGVIYDFDLKVDAGRVTSGHRPAALVWGDIHERHLGLEMRELAWGDGGILDQINPERQVMHDLLDFRAQNHHDRKDPWRRIDKYVSGRSNVETEIRYGAQFLAHEAHRFWCDTIVVCSNHDVALIRWLKEADWREDPENAAFFLKANCAAVEALTAGQKDFYAVEWAFRNVGMSLPSSVTFLRMDESYIVCPDANGGIELGMHGHVGINGARGNYFSFANTGRKSVTGHSHVAGQHQGSTVVGVMGSLDMSYNDGMSAWSRTNALVYPNGKRALFTIWNGKYRGKR